MAVSNITNSFNATSQSQQAVQLYAKEINVVAGMLKEIVYLYNNRDTVDKLVGNTQLLKEVSNSLNIIREVYENLSDLLLLQENIPDIKIINDSLPDLKRLHEGIEVVKKVYDELDKTLNKKENPALLELKDNTV